MMSEKEPNKFLLGEVREGFFVPAQIKMAWNAQLKILKEIDRVCSENGIMYFADWGTMLGAIRHGGYIPWDDDMDIVMKREDYTRFLNIAKTTLPEGYHIQTLDNQPDFWLFMGKVVAKNRICFDAEHLREFDGFPYIACVDIFVLDYVIEDTETEKQRCHDLTYALAVADGIVEGKYTGMRKEELLRELDKMFGVTLPRSEDSELTGRSIYHEVERHFAKITPDMSNVITQMFPWGLKGPERYMPKSIFEDCIRVPYEDMMISVPLAYDYFIEKCYHRYWDIYKDGGAHEYPFFEGQKENLKKVLDFEMPEYTFSEDELFLRKSISKKSEGYKELALEALDEIKNMCYRIASKACNESDYADSQQLAIDLGTMIESVKGEGTESVKSLERLCELLYQAGCGNTITDELTNEVNVLSANIHDEIIGKEDVVFICSFASDFKTFENIYTKYSNDESYDVHVLAVPYFYKDYDGSAKYICYEKDDFPKELNVRDYREFSLELVKPSIICFQDPYDNENPVYSVSMDFYSDKLLELSDKLIYVPPMMMDDFTVDDGREYKNMMYYVTVPGVIHADEIVVNSEAMKAVYVSKLTEFSGEKYEQIWDSKIQIVEQTKRNMECDRTSKDENRKKRILFVTSLGRFFEEDIDVIGKLKTVFETFEASKGAVEVRWYIYPGVTATHLLETEQKIPEELREQLYELKAAHSDILVKMTEDRVDYKELEDESDAYYGDTCPLIRLFQRAKKPVMIMDYRV